MTSTRLFVVLAVLAAVALTGCTPAPLPDETTPPAEPPTAQPLTCDELAPQNAVEEALRGTAQPVEPLAQWLSWSVPVTSATAVKAAGGLDCAWLGTDLSGEMGRAWLEVSVLPGAADSWAPTLFGDGPTSETRRIGGRTLTASCGDPGCGVTSVAGTSWVIIHLMDPGLLYGVGLLGTSDDIFEQATPFIDSILDTVAGATPQQLAWPAIDATPADDDSCARYLPPDVLGTVIGGRVDGYEPVQYAPDWQRSLAQQRAGFFTCHAHVDASAVVPGIVATFHVAPGNAPSLDGLAAVPGSDLRLDELSLPGQAEDGVAFDVCASAGVTVCNVLFSLGDDAIQVEPREVGQARLIAEAIMAHAQ